MNTVAIPGPRVRLSRKACVAGATVLVAVAAVACGAHWWRVGRFVESTDDAYVRADVVTVSPRVAGHIAQVSVADNQAVHRGDVLLRLDDRDYRARVQRAQAEVAAAEAAVQAQTGAVAALDAEIARQADVIAQARAEAAGAAADAVRRTSDATRYRDLLADDATSRQRWEQSDADARKARATLAQAEAGLRVQSEQAQVLLRRRDQGQAAIAQAEAGLATAKAALALAQLDLEHTVIRAVRDGTVGQRAARAGQYVEPGAPLLALVPLDDVYVVANFKETQITRMRAGQSVEVDVDAYPGHPLHGVVDGFAPGSGAQFALLPPDNATGNFTKIVQRVPVKIRLDAAGGASALRPGLSVVARIDTRAGGQP